MYPFGKDSGEGQLEPGNGKRIQQQYEVGAMECHVMSLKKTVFISHKSPAQNYQTLKNLLSHLGSTPLQDPPLSHTLVACPTS